MEIKWQINFSLLVAAKPFSKRTDTFLLYRQMLWHLIRVQIKSMWVCVNLKNQIWWITLIYNMSHDKCSHILVMLINCGFWINELTNTNRSLIVSKMLQWTKTMQMFVQHDNKSTRARARKRKNGTNKQLNKRKRLLLCIKILNSYWFNLMSNMIINGFVFWLNNVDVYTCAHARTLAHNWSFHLPTTETRQ